MSRSRRKTPLMGVTCTESEKEFKRIENKRRRAAERSGKEFIPASYGPKDGRQWINPKADKGKWMRK